MADAQKINFEDMFEPGDEVHITKNFQPGDQVEMQDVRLRDREIYMIIWRDGMGEDTEPLKIIATETDWNRLLEAGVAFWPFEDIEPGMKFEYTIDEQFKQIPI